MNLWKFVQKERLFIRYMYICILIDHNVLGSTSCFRNPVSQMAETKKLADQKIKKNNKNVPQVETKSKILK